MICQCASAARERAQRAGTATGGHSDARVKVLAQLHGVSYMIGVGQNDPVDAPEAFQMLLVVLRERQGVDHNVTLLLANQHAVEVDVALSIELGPGKEIREMQGFHDGAPVAAVKRILFVLIDALDSTIILSSIVSEQLQALTNPFAGAESFRGQPARAGAFSREIAAIKAPEGVGLQIEGRFTRVIGGARPHLSTQSVIIGVLGAFSPLIFGRKR